MRLLVRVLLAVFLLAGTALWLPDAVTTAAARLDADPAAIRAPAADNHNENWDDNVYTDDNDNDYDNDNDFTSSGVPTDVTQTGQQVSSGDLTVDLWLSADHPVYNQELRIGVTGNGSAIDSIWWWAEGPGGGGDDPANMGVQSIGCGGAQPCSKDWQTVPRGVGQYTIHARARDTSGREVETVRQVFVSENPR